MEGKEQIDNSYLAVLPNSDGVLSDWVFRNAMGSTQLQYGYNTVVLVAPGQSDEIRMCTQEFSIHVDQATNSVTLLDTANNLGLDEGPLRDDCEECLKGKSTISRFGVTHITIYSMRN